MWTQRRSGQLHQREQDHRDAYERDRTRLIHCSAFRRLQCKTQILGTDAGDFHRTRMTHSIEVASIGRSIVRNLAAKYPQHPVLPELLPNEDLISVICLSHDIGHPPFGHGGEAALNYVMRNHGGFEGNGQTLRLLMKIEQSYGPFGLDLTRRTLLGILKYPIIRNKVLAPQSPPLTNSVCLNNWLPPKAYLDCEKAEVDWLLSSLDKHDRDLFQSLRTVAHAKKHGESAYYSFDCSIMNTADDIAYGVHDLEDAIHLELITREQFANDSLYQLLQATPMNIKPLDFVDSLFSPESSKRKHAIGALVNYFITTIQIGSTNEEFTMNLLKYNVNLLPEGVALLNYLIRCIYQCVIDSQNARIAEHCGQTVLVNLFEAISSNPITLLDEKNRELVRQADNETTVLRLVCDYIANMTDQSAIRLYNRLFGSHFRK